MAASKAVITILGIQGGYVTKDKEVVFSNFAHKANYYFEEETLQQEYFNTLPLLIKKYHQSHKIIPIFTEDAKLFNEKVLQDGYIDLKTKIDFHEKYLIQDEKNFNDIFRLVNAAIDDFDEVIVDVSHGFRHLPILMTVDLIIQNFQNTDKIKKILFAKEVIKHEPDPKQKGLYEIIDLKEYLDLANIAFVLTAFEKNYTVSSHIKSEKYNSLIEALNDFSNDIMALNLNNLFTKSSKNLMRELEKIKDASILKQAQNLKERIEELTAYQGKKYYQTYFDLSKDLFEKNYMLLSLALLFESIRMYIKTTLKKEHKELVEKVENSFDKDLYKIGDFFKNLKHPIRDKYNRDEKNRNSAKISLQEYKTLKTSFDGFKIVALYDKIDKKRNNLAHANTNGNFQTIHDDIKELIEEYEKFISPKNTNDLKAKFNNNQRKPTT
jgi:CRISPR-associated DxTHG motif protein